MLILLKYDKKMGMIHMNPTHLYLISNNKKLKMRCPVETMCAYLFFGKSDGVNEVFEGVEFERGQTIAFSHFLYHLTISATSGLGIVLQMSVGVPFQFFDDASRQEFHLRFGRGEV